MKKLIILALLCQPAYAQTWAQLAIGGGFESVLIVTNKGDEEWTGELDLRQGNIEPWGSSWLLNGVTRQNNVVPITIPPKGTSKYVLSSPGGVQAGYLRMNSESFSLDTSTQFFYLLRQGGQLIDSIGSPESEWGRRFVFGVEKSPTTNTGFAWAPSSSFFPQNFSVIMTLFNSSGNQVEQKVVQFEGHAARFFDEIFSVGSSFIGHVFIDATDYMYLTILRMDMTPSGPQFTSVLPDIYIP